MGTGNRFKICFRCGHFYNDPQRGGKPRKYCQRCVPVGTRSERGHRRKYEDGRPCQKCGDPITGQVRGRARKYCVTCEPNMPLVKDREPKFCAVCGKPFLKRKDAIYCSVACCSQAARDRLARHAAR